MQSPSRFFHRPWATTRNVWPTRTAASYRLYLQAGDGSGQATRLVKTETTQIGPAATPDGTGVVFTEVASGTRVGVRLVTLSTGEIVSLVDTASVAPDGAMMSVPVRSRAAAWAVGPPTRLFNGSYSTRDGQLVVVSPQYDTLDGQRFLMLKSEARASIGPDASEIIVVQNWVEALKRLAPAN